MSSARERTTPPRPPAIDGTMMLDWSTRAATASPRRKRGLLKRLPTTREGVWFMSATLVVGAAAVNAGLNLLFLVFGMMLFLILASGIMSELTLRQLTVRRKLPAAIHAGSPFLIGISVRNNKKHTPTFSLEVEDLADERPVERRCYFLKIPAGREQETAYRNVVSQRGIHSLSGLRVSTRFPFGLIRKAHDITAKAQLLVYPALVPVPPLLAADGGAPLPDRRNARASRSGEFHGLREYREGDDPRQIHWRSSARRGRWLVREHEDDAGGRVVVKLQWTAVTVGNENQALEQAVSMAASVALYFLKRGYEVALAAGQVSVAARAGNQQSHTLLAALAVVTMADIKAPGGPLGSASVVARVVMSDNAPRVLVASGARGQAA